MNDNSPRPDCDNIASVLAEASTFYADASVMFPEPVDRSPMARSRERTAKAAARQDRIAADLTAALEKLSVPIWLFRDQYGYEKVPPGILRHVEARLLFRGVFTTIDPELADWRHMEGASVLIEVKHVPAVVGAVRAVIEASERPAKRGRPTKGDQAAAAYHALFPQGHGRLGWARVAERVSEKMGQTVTDETLRKWLRNTK